MKKKIIISILFVILLSSIIIGFNNVNGESFSSATDPSKYASATDETETSGSVRKIMGSALVVVQVVAVGVAFIMLVVLGIKYMSAAPGDRAEIKKHLFVYVIGALIVFAAAGIIGIINKFAQQIKV